MSLDLLAGPALEPVSLADAKSHLRVDGAAEDAYIATLIITSRLQVEAALGLALIAQRWIFRPDQWPACGALDLPLRPVMSVDAVRVSDASGDLTTVPAARYIVDGDANPARLVARGGPLPAPGLPLRGIEIEFEAGFGPVAADVPEPIRHAILLLVAHWYEHREPALEGAAPAALPPLVSELLTPYRTVRL